MSTEFINDQWRLPNEENKSKVSNYSMDFLTTTRIPDITGLGLGTSVDTFSISLWFNKSNMNYGIVFSTYSGSGSYPSSGVAIDLNTDGTIAFYNGANRTTTSAQYSINTWYNLVVTSDGTTVKMYVNGSQVTLNSTTAVARDFTNVWINSAKYSASNFGIVGKIDGVAIFDYALSSSQITTLYGSSSTGIGNPMSLSPKPVATYNLGDKSAFNGSSYLTPNASLKDFVFDFVPSDNINTSHIGFFDGSTTLSISGWFNFDDISVNRDLMSQWVYNTTNGSFSLRRSSGNLLALFVKTGSSSIGSDYYYANLATSSTGHSAGVWYHLAVTVDNGTCLIYLNGQALTTSTGGSPQTTLQTSTADFKLGYWQTSTTTFNGKMSNIKLWSSKLEATEIETLYNNGSPIETLANIPQNSNLQGWWKLDASATYDSSTTTWNIPDDSTNSNDGTSSGMTQANLVQSDLSFRSGYSPYALDFDSASSDAITLGNTIGNGFTQITCSIWANISTSGLTQSTYRNFLVKFPSGSGDATPFELRSNNGNRTDSYNNKLFFRINTNTGSYGFTDAGFEFTESNKWYHLVGTYDGSNVKLFVDGVEYYSISASGTLNSNNNNATIGKSGSTGNFNGKLSNASIWNTALTSAQVSELYNEGVPSNLNNHSAYSNLVSWWQLGSNSSFNSSLNQWTCIDEKGTNTGESSQTFAEDAIVDGVGSYANGLSYGMGGDEVIGDAPYSSSNSLSVNMDVEDRVTDTPS